MATCVVVPSTSLFCYVVLMPLERWAVFLSRVSCDCRTGQNRMKTGGGGGGFTHEEWTHALLEIVWYFLTVCLSLSFQKQCAQADREHPVVHCAPGQPEAH